jgi:protocatechuate 3,4-dioxygenase beta subunit
VETDVNGLASVTGLPPRVPLELTIHARGTLARKESAPVTLEPGERRRIEVHVGSGGSIVGRIEDGDGKPVKHCQIWRVAGEPGFEQLLRSYEPPAASSRSDEDGRFRFDDVAQGKWLVGPAPAKDGEPNVSDKSAIAPFAQPVEIADGAGEVELVLRVDRGLYITGRVLDPSGGGVKDTYASAQQVNGFMSVMERTDDSGQFVLGPLLAGEFDLEAGGMMGPHAKSETVRASAGARDVVLRLRVGGAITGRVVDASGAARECELSLSQPSVEFGWMQTGTRDGSIKFDGLLAGSYNLHAITSDGQIGSRVGIVVGEGETVDGVEVTLAPGARLEVRYAGERHVATYEVLAAGDLCWVSSLESGSQESRVVPAGDLEVRWRTYPETATHSDRFKLAAGEKREVAWDGKP